MTSHGRQWSRWPCAVDRNRWPVARIAHEATGLAAGSNMEAAKPTMKLLSRADLPAGEFRAEVKKARGRKARPMTGVALQALRDEYTATIEPVRVEASEESRLERELSDLVNSAY